METELGIADWVLQTALHAARDNPKNRRTSRSVTNKWKKFGNFLRVGKEEGCGPALSLPRHSSNEEAINRLKGNSRTVLPSSPEM